VVGGGLRDSRLGELAIGRASVILKATGGIDIDLVPIHHHPDEAGLIGAAHLMPSWMFAGHDSLLAVDIGGTNIRAGLGTVVELADEEGLPRLGTPAGGERLVARHDGVAQLQLRDDLPGERGERHALLAGEIARDVIEHA